MRRKMGVDGGKEEKREGYDVGRMLGGGRKGRASLTNLKVGNASTIKYYARSWWAGVLQGQWR